MHAGRDTRPDVPRKSTGNDGHWIELLEEANCPSRVKAAGRQTSGSEEPTVGQGAE